MRKNNFAEKTSLLLLILLFAVGQFYFVPVKAKTNVKKSVVPETSSGWEFKEHEVVVKIDCSNCLGSIAKKYDVLQNDLQALLGQKTKINTTHFDSNKTNQGIQDSGKKNNPGIHFFS